jgi:hypothetical protein
MDKKSFILGFLAAIVLVLLWRFFTSKKSFFDSGIFTPGMSFTEAQQVFENAKNDITTRYNDMIKSAQDKGEDVKDLLKEAAQAMSDLSIAYNNWSIEQAPSPAPAPAETVTAVPSPSPENM